MRKELVHPLYDALVCFMAMSKHQMFEIAAEYGLTSTQAFMLMLMKDDGNRTMSGFSDLLGCDASNVTGLVDGLQRKKLLERREHPTDRRVKILCLTAEGKKLRAGIFARMDDQNKSYIAANLSDDEIEQLIGLLQKITHTCPGQTKG